MTALSVASTTGKCVLDATNRYVDRRDRLAKRKTVRRQIAEVGLHEAKCRERRKRIEELNHEADVAVQRHEAQTAPVQAELSKIEDEIADAIADRTEVAESLTQRRQQLLDQLLELNSALEVECKALKAKRTVLQADESREAMRRTGQPNSQTLENSLCREPLVCPSLFAESFARERALHWCKARLDAARAECAKWSQCSDKVKSGEWRTANGRNVYESRITRWEAERSAAQAAYDAAVQASSEMRQRMIGE